MLAWAVKMSLVGRNVVSAVDAPAVRRSEAKAFEADEIARVLDAARGTRWHSFIALAFALGARRGELLALKWPVVDFERGVVRIEGSLSQTKAGVTMKGTKTDRVRTVPLSSFALDALRRQKVAQAADRLAAGASYKDDGFVFADAVGRRITPWNASYAFGELARKGWDLVDTLARRATHRGDDDAGRRDRRALGSRNARSQLSGDDDDGLRASARGRDG
jgi:integrase